MDKNKLKLENTKKVSLNLGTKMTQNLTEQERKAYKQAFEFFDTDGSGQISIIELSDAMKRLGYAVEKNHIQAVLREIDTDGSGSIGLDEFIQFATRAGQT